MRTQGTVMAFDYGRKRIGVAVGQTVSRTATPLRVLAAKHGKPNWDELSRLVDDWLPNLFVVGEPRYEDGAVHPLAAEIERFSKRLSGRFKVPVIPVDETLSSYAAGEDVGAADDVLDAHAARAILQTWLDGNGSVDA